MFAVIILSITWFWQHRNHNALLHRNHQWHYVLAAGYNATTSTFHRYHNATAEITATLSARNHGLATFCRDGVYTVVICVKQALDEATS